MLPPCPLPTNGRPAAPRTEQTKRPLQRPALGKRGREPGRGGSPPSPSAAAALTHWRPTRPRPAPPAARQPPRHEYTPGGRAGDYGWQADAQRGGGAGGSGATPRPPLLLLPPSLRATGATLRPPGAEGTPPLPRKGPRRGGGGGAAGPAHRAPQRPQPPAPARGAVDGRAHTSAPERRADQAWAWRTAGHLNSMGAPPPMTPPMTIAHSGRAEGGFRSEGAPRGAVHGLPRTPPPSRAAPQPQPNAHAGGECADDKRGARVGNRGPPP